MDHAPYRFRMRWWMWLILVALLLASAALTLRVHGQVRFDAVQADLRARGFLVDRRDMLADAPAVDADRQRRLEDLFRRMGKWGDNPGSLPGRALGERRYTQQELDKRADFLRLGRTDATAVAALLAEGPTLMSYYGSMERDADRLDSLSLNEIWGNSPTSSLLCARAVTNWWALTAVTAEDPRPALAELDRLRVANSQPATMIDAMISLAIHAIHDQTCLYLATRGRLPEDALARWLSQQRDYLPWVATAFQNERCLSFSRIARIHIGELSALGVTASGSSTAPWWSGIQDIPYWVICGHYGAVGVAEMANAEAQMRGLPPVEIPRMPFGLPALLSSIAIPNLLESAITAMESSYGTRLRQTMAVIACRYRAGTPLPIDQTALAVWLPPGWLDGRDANNPPIAYERLSASRVRVGLDPAQPRPAMIPASRWGSLPGARTYGSTVGSPASAKIEEDTRWSLEIDLDAILVPPPEKPPRK